MAKNYKPDKNGNTKCIECGQVIHKGCYEKLLPHTHTQMKGSDE